MPDITITVTSDQLNGIAAAVQDIKGGEADTAAVAAYLKECLETCWNNYEVNKVRRTLERKTL
jgi:hypothetical protein